MSSDDFEEFEKQVEDVVDPSPWHIAEGSHNGIRIMELLRELIPPVMEDIDHARQKGDAPMAQYLNAATGATITTGVTPTGLVIQVDFTVDQIMRMVELAALQDVINQDELDALDNEPPAE